jgi:tetratricopeptide (TPR) repeat protein
MARNHQYWGRRLHLHAFELGRKVRSSRGVGFECLARGRLQVRALASTFVFVGNAKLPETDMEDPSYDVDFACGRAALAQHNLDQARHHFDRLYRRFPGSALARYAVGDLLLWQNIEPERAHKLLTGALTDDDRLSLPHWSRLGLEAELRASHVWSLACMHKPEAIQYGIDKAIQLAGQNKPVRAAVHLRLGYALLALNRSTRARQHWRVAHDADPHGWAGNQAAREITMR